MSICPTIDANAGGAQTLDASVDCFVRSTVQDGYAAFLGQGSMFSQALTIALTLYVAIIGYQLILGRSSLSMSNFVPKALVIGGVLALSTNWAAYQVLVFDLLTDGPQEIATIMGSQGGDAQSITKRVDGVSDIASKIAEDWSASGAQQNPGAIPPAPVQPTAGAIPAPTAVLPQLGTDSPGPNILLLSALLLTLASVGVLAVAKILLGLLLALGPIFVALGLFASTRGLTYGWLRASVMMALVPLFSLMACAGALQIIEPLINSMAGQAASGTFSLRPALAFLVVVLVMAGVSLLLFRVTGTITGNWSASFGKSSSPQNEMSVEGATLTTENTQSSVVNPRIDVLVSALERRDLNTQMISNSNSVRRDITSASQILLPEGRTASDMSQSSRRMIGSSAPASARSPLRPVRNAA
jgi:type IV secretion system protein VirB6